MVYTEYGAGKGEAILLLHGGGLGPWNYREAALRLQGEYRVILPVLDGHAGSSRPFTSIGDCAAEVLELIDSLGADLRLIGGLSLGGQVALEALARRPDLCPFALAESAMAIPSPLTHAMIRPAFGCSWGLTQRHWFARLQFRSLHMPEALFEDYWRDTRQITRGDMIAFLEANTAWDLPDALGECSARLHIYCGSRETRGIRRSAELLHARVPGSRLTVLPGLYHGGFSLGRPAEFAEEIRRILRGGE